MTAALQAHPNISIVDSEHKDLPASGQWIIATGPLTSRDLGQAIQAENGTEALAFFDAIAPIVYHDSIDMSQAWMQSRYDKGETEAERTAYLNCPMDHAQYEAFIDALLTGDKMQFKNWEASTPYFDGCMPIEIMASRGRETLRFGPMKPVGLTNPRAGKAAHAVVQLRQDNRLGTLWNIVGFQTKLKYGAQADVLRMIPGLEAAEFARLGGIHRNSFIRSPVLLDEQLRLRADPRVRFAGQITPSAAATASSAACVRVALT